VLVANFVEKYPAMALIASLQSSPKSDGGRSRTSNGTRELVMITVSLALCRAALMSEKINILHNPDRHVTRATHAPTYATCVVKRIHRAGLSKVISKRSVEHGKRKSPRDYKIQDNYSINESRIRILFATRDQAAFVPQGASVSLGQPLSAGALGVLR
jgi:hypothetical protein